MHVFGVVLENGEEGFFEDEYPRYLFLYRGLNLKKLLQACTW